MNPDEARRLLIVASMTLSACSRHPVASLQLPAMLHSHGIDGNPSFLLSQAADLTRSIANTPAAIDAACRFYSVPTRSLSH